MADEAEAPAIAIATVAASSPPDAPASSPVGSPEISDSPPSDDLISNKTLSDDLRDKIIRQVEYYFSDENLPTDKFLMKYVSKDKKGFVPIAVVASFQKMKKLVQDLSLVVAALRESSVLVVSADGKKVRRLHPLPIIEVKDTKLYTVLVENLPEDHSTENIQKIFGCAGNIKNIFVNDPHAVCESKTRTVTDKLLSGKLHALVEYDTVEAAEKAVATLNNDQDWRFGMRVKLIKKMVKHPEKKKSQRESESEKGNVQAAAAASDLAGDVENHDSSEHQDETPNEEAEGQHIEKEKNGNKGRNRVRNNNRRQQQKYRGGTNGHGHGHGHGHGSLSSSLGSEISKPPPGPRMPDGTRGFAMGRGKPPPPPVASTSNVS